MKKIILMAAFCAVAYCKKEAAFVSEQRVCSASWENSFNNTFKLCMSGQRHTTATDDADDFVKQCRFTALKVADQVGRCEIIRWVCTVLSGGSSLIYATHDSYYTRSNCDSVPVQCDNATRSDYVKACGLKDR